MAVGDTFYQDEGVAITLGVLYAVSYHQLAVVNNIIGIAKRDAASGENVALSQEHAVYRIQVPTALAVETGDTIYIEVADLTGHTPDSTAYSKTAGEGKVAVFQAVSDQNADDYVQVKFIVN